MTNRTIETHVSPALLAAVFPPQEREPEPPLSDSEWTADQILVREAKAECLAATQELPAVQP